MKTKIEMKGGETNRNILDGVDVEDAELLDAVHVGHELDEVEDGVALRVLDLDLGEASGAELGRSEKRRRRERKGMETRKKKMGRSRRRGPEQRQRAWPGCRSWR